MYYRERRYVNPRTMCDGDQRGSGRRSRWWTSRSTQGRLTLELGYTLAERTLIVVRALRFYAGKLLWSAEQAVICPRW